jgi:ABC-type glucose/galactose transport system permease subunit
MIVIYHDVGGAHSSCICANIHINKLKMDKIPNEEEILSLPTFDKITKTEYGRLIYIGTDEFGAKVYTLCRMRSKKYVIPAISDMYQIFNGDMNGFFLADTSPTVNNLMRLGGISSRVLGLVSFGRPIVAKGTLKGYTQMAELVKTTKEYISNHI